MTLESQDFYSGTPDCVLHNQWAVGKGSSIEQYVVGVTKQDGVIFTDDRNQALIFSEYEYADRLRTLLSYLQEPDLYVCLDLTEE